MFNKDKVGNLKNYVGEALTAVVFLALIVYSFVGIGLKDKIDDGFWTTFAVNFGLMLLITTIWYPEAKRKAQIQDKGYINQRKKYGGYVDRVVATKNQKGLAKFCEYATERNRVFKIQQRLIKINVEYDFYLACLKDVSKIEKNEFLNDKQKKKLKKLIENGVTVKKISYSHIITGIKNAKFNYDTKSGEQKYDTTRISFKIVFSLISAAFTAYIVFMVGGFTWESIAQLFMWAILIIWNMITSYRTGYKSISVFRCEYYKKLRTFLEEFISSEYYDNTIKYEEKIDEEEQKEQSTEQ